MEATAPLEDTNRMRRRAGIHRAPVPVSGYLFKVGKVRKSWKRRWFVLDSGGRRLVYYDRPPESGGRAHGEVLLTSASRLHDDRGSVEDEPGTRTGALRGTVGFRVSGTHGDRTFYLRGSPDEVARWISVLQDILGGVSVSVSASDSESAAEESYGGPLATTSEEEDSVNLAAMAVAATVSSSSETGQRTTGNPLMAMGAAGDAMITSLKKSFVAWAVRHNPRESGGPLEGSKVFGVPLEKVCRRENVLVPSLVETLAGVIREPANRTVQGVFRLSGRGDVIRRLRKQFNSGELLPAELATATVHDVASLLQAYVRELPEPLMTFAMYDRVVSVFAEQRDDEQRLACARACVRELPACHQKVLMLLLDVMVDVADHAEVNQMNEGNLATVWAPNMFRPRPIEGEDSTLQFLRWLQESPLLMTCVRLLIFQRRQETNRFSLHLDNADDVLAQECLFENGENARLLRDFVDSYSSANAGLRRRRLWRASPSPLALTATPPPPVQDPLNEAAAAAAEAAARASLVPLSATSGFSQAELAEEVPDGPSSSLRSDTDSMQTEGVPRSAASMVHRPTLGRAGPFVRPLMPAKDLPPTPPQLAVPVDGSGNHSAVPEESSPLGSPTELDDDSGDHSLHDSVESSEDDSEDEDSENESPEKQAMMDVVNVVLHSLELSFKSKSTK